MFVKNKPYTITDSHPNWETVLNIVKGHQDAPSDDELVKLLDVRQAIVDTLFHDRITVGHDSVMVDGNPIHSYLATRIIAMAREGIDVTPWLKFLNRLWKNPSKQVYDDLFAWMEASNMPVTPEGKFIAYKRVNNDYTSKHDGKTRNDIGTMVEMPRREVDDRRENTCSTGLHFANYDYAKNFGSGKMLVLEVDPTDVVSIPVDYNQTKGRAWRYLVIDEMADETVDNLTGTHVYTPAGYLGDMDINEGDTVIVVEANDPDITVGAKYVVYFDGFGEPYIIDDAGDDNEVSETRFRLA